MPKSIRSYLQFEIDYLPDKINFGSIKKGEKAMKQEHFTLIATYFSIFIGLHRMRLTDPPILFNLWNDIIQVSQHLNMLYVPQMFFKNCWKTK